MKFIKYFKEISMIDFHKTGFKGANLGELFKIKVPVPNGFVILTDAFKKFLSDANINGEIDLRLRKINFDNIESIRKASKIIRKLILGAKIPNEIEKEILYAFKKLNIKHVAVRSSATVEDSEISSWAGSLETYLNTTKKSLIKNVKKCWASFFSSKALLYRMKKNIIRNIASVGIIVQKMVQSEIAGVCFTIHPLKKDKNKIVIEAVWGLGEILNQGKITPDNYVIEKSSLKILEINKNPQNKMVIKSKNGTKVVYITNNKREKQKLSEKQIKELAKLCLKIEDYFKNPQDIEWVFRKGKFFIIQTRPVTMLSTNKKF